MAARTRFALVFWMAIAVAVTILTIKPWARAPEARRGKSSTGLHTGPCTEGSASDPGR
jgi:hypothetical protein